MAQKHIFWYLASMEIFLVGGAVRDLLMGKGSRDRDYLVLGATPGQFMKRFPRARQVGKSFPVFLVNGEEYAFPRDCARQSTCCGFGLTDLMNELAADLKARDFTVNALALALPGHPDSPDPADMSPEAIRDSVIGLPTSLRDLDAGVLRQASARSVALDPLRVFRAARFAARWPSFSLSEELEQAMAEAASRGLLDDLSPERIGAETRKALLAPAPGNFLRVLERTGCLAPWFAELDGTGDIPAGPLPHHAESVLEHTAEVMDRLAEWDASDTKNSGPGDGPGDKPDMELAMWMGLCHDLGKSRTPPDEHPSHHGHDAMGVEPALRLGNRLALPMRFIKAGAEAARLHMTAARYPELRPGTRVDLLDRLNACGILEEMCALVRADHGLDISRDAARDLKIILDVKLPEDMRDLGPESGQRLRDMRCQALAGNRG